MPGMDALSTPRHKSIGADRTQGQAKVENQIVLLSERINYLTEHLRVGGADFSSSRRGLLMLVRRRRRLLDELRQHEPKRYQALIRRLGLRTAQRLPAEAGPPASPDPGAPDPRPQATGPASDPAATPDAGEELQRALQQARERGRTRVAEILAGEDMLSAAAFATFVGTSRMTINTWRERHQVLGLDGARRGFRFPKWQVGDDGKPFAALPALFERLGDSPWAVYRFLVQHHPELDGLTGREALRRGRVAAALEAAERVVGAVG